MTELHGEELLRDLEERFDMVTQSVTAGALHMDILKPRNADALISEADFVLDERLPYWADVWPASLALSARLAAEPNSRGSAIELGCGIGIVTVAAISAGLDVLATDYYEPALEFTRANVYRNFARSGRTRLVNWRNIPEDLGKFDLFLASDVLYEKEYAALFPDLIRKLVAPGGEALIADPGRVGAPEFLRHCEHLGFGMSVETTAVTGELGKTHQVDIHHITP